MGHAVGLAGLETALGFCSGRCLLGMSFILFIINLLEKYSTSVTFDLGETINLACVLEAVLLF